MTEHHLRFQEHGHHEPYIMVYSATEMQQIFSKEQREQLANGEMIITPPQRGRQTSIVDLNAFFVQNNRFGVAA